MEVEQKRLIEKELIERVKKGESSAFYELISDYRIRLFRKACGLLGNPEDAEDILQEALVTAYQAIHKFRGESGIYTWLYRIVVNKCRDHLRSRRSKKEESLEPFSPIISDNRISLEKNLELSDDAGYLISKINSLNKKYKQILIMRYYDELSYQEIAELSHINVGTVKSRLFKARELLKRAILRNGLSEEYFAT